MTHCSWSRWLIILHLSPFICYTKKSDNDEKFVVEGCAFTRLNLNCDDTKKIEILTVVLGDSECDGKNCCIKASDCTVAPSKNHLLFVETLCNEQQRCRAPVSHEPIRCSRLSIWNPNDFERIIYRCRSETGTSSPGGDGGVTGDREQDNDISTGGSKSNIGNSSSHELQANVLPMITGIITCLAVFVAIAVVLIVAVRKQRQKTLRVINAETTAHGVIGNEAGVTSEVGTRKTEKKMGTVSEIKTSEKSSENLNDGVYANASETKKITKSKNTDIQGPVADTLYETLNSKPSELHEYECLPSSIKRH